MKLDGLAASAQSQHQMESRLLLNVVIGESSAVLKLLSSENQSLLIRGDALLVLDLRLDVLNGVRRLDIESDGLAGQGLDKDLHSSTEAEHKMQGRFLLDVVVRQGTSILELLASEDEALLVGRNTLLVLNLRLHVLDSIGRLHIEGDRLSSQSLNEDLHATAKTQDEMERGLLLDVIVRERASVFELFAGENQSLLIRRDSLLILDLRLNILDRVRRLNVERNRLAGERLDENLHAATQTEHEMEGRLFLDVVVTESAAIFQLLSGKDESLLVRRDAFFVLDLGLDVFDGVRGLDVKGDSLASKGLHEDLHV